MAAPARPGSIGARATGRDNHFNLIRFLAAGAVLVSHAYPITLGPATAQPLSRLLPGMTLGEVAVFVFFAVSGFFIAQSFDRSRSAAKFLRARALRLFPALVVMLALTVAAGAALTTAGPAAYWRGAAEYLARGVTLVAMRYDLPGVFAANPYGPPVNGSLWTLRYEVACYLTILAAGVLRLPGRAVALVALAGLGGLSVAGPETLLRSGAAVALAGLALPFWMGTALYFWRDRVPHAGWILAALLAAAAAARGSALQEAAVAAVLAYGAIWAGYLRVPALLAFNRLGDYSYGIYIYAFPVQQLAAHFGVTTPVLNMALAAPAVLVLAALSWHLVEAPSLALKARRPVRPEPQP